MAGQNGLGHRERRAHWLVQVCMPAVARLPKYPAFQLALSD
jgi:hypothetical protein